MKTKKLNKLGLNKQTVAKLNDLAAVKGGNTDLSCCTCVCTDTCCTCHTICDHDDCVACTMGNSTCQVIPNKLDFMNTKIFHNTNFIKTTGAIKATIKCR